MFFILDSNSQNKRKEIQKINSNIDSLIYVIKKNKDSLNYEINRLNNLFITLQTEIKNKEELSNKRFKNLRDSSLIRDSLIKLQFLEINELKEKLNNLNFNKKNKIILPYKYSKIKDYSEGNFLSTVFISSRNQTYIIVDSAQAVINNNDEIFIYFLTPLENEINLACPGEFGMIVINNFGKIVYNDFWISPNIGNCKPRFFNLRSNDFQRNLLSFGLSACGSGILHQFYDVYYSDNNFFIQKSFLGGQAGYSEIFFVPEENIYILFNRLNPACHYGCPSIYELTYFSLKTDKLLFKKITKLEYGDFNDIGLENLVSKIRNLEPEVLLFK